MTLLLVAWLAPAAATAGAIVQVELTDATGIATAEQLEMCEALARALRSRDLVVRPCETNSTEIPDAVLKLGAIRVGSIIEVEARLLDGLGREILVRRWTDESNSLFTGDTGTKSLTDIAEVAATMERPRGVTTGEWVGLGIAAAGAASLIVGTVFGVLAAVNEDRVAENKAGAQLDADRAQRYGRVANITWATGGGLVLTGAAIWLMSGHDQPVTVEPSVNSNDGAQLNLRLRF